MSTADCDKDVTWHAPDNSFKKHLIHQGQGEECPADGATCMVTMEVINTDELAQFALDDGFWGYPLWEKTEVQIGEGDTEMSVMIDRCLNTMRKEEICELSCQATSSRQNGDKLQVICAGRGSAPTANSLTDVNLVPVEIRLKLELISFDEGILPLWQLSPGDKMTKALHHKLKGTELFKTDNVEFAFKRYSKSLKILISMLPESSIPEEIMTEYSELRCHCYLNLAACQLRTKKWKFVISNCTKALDIQPSSVKALYRRGIARKSLGEFEAAFADLMKCLEMEPQNKTACKALRDTEIKLKEQNSTLAAGLSKMFPT